MTRIFDRIEQNTRIAKVTLHSVVDRQGVAAELFSALGEHGHNIELISTSSAGRGRADKHEVNPVAAIEYIWW
jgi:aspartokinase